MMYQLLFYLLAVFCVLWGDRIAQERLDPYRHYLDWGTYADQDWSLFASLPRSRYDTFRWVFGQLQDRNPVVVELGTSRSFTHGRHSGCNLDDARYWMPNQPENWDWGAGFFTRMAVVCLAHQDVQLHTVDLVGAHINRCKIMTQDYAQYISYHVCSSESFLKQCVFPQGIDLLYLDTGDMTPIEPTAQLQLAEARIIVERDLIAKNGLILIDDVKNQTPKKFGESSEYGKAKYSLPYLLEHGFELVMDEYQVVLRKK